MAMITGWVNGAYAKLQNIILAEKERVHFKDDDEEDVLNDLNGCHLGYDYYGRDIYELSDEEWDKLYAEVSWEKVIIVYINA